MAAVKTLFLFFFFLITSKLNTYLTIYFWSKKLIYKWKQELKNWNSLCNEGTIRETKMDETVCMCSQKGFTSSKSAIFSNTSEEKIFYTHQNYVTL